MVMKHQKINHSNSASSGREPHVISRLKEVIACFLRELIGKISLRGDITVLLGEGVAVPLTGPLEVFWRGYIAIPPRETVSAPP